MRKLEIDEATFEILLQATFGGKAEEKNTVEDEAPTVKANAGKIKAKQKRETVTAETKEVERPLAKKVRVCFLS